MDRLTAKYVTEVKKSDADIDAGTWHLLYYLKVLKDKGIIRKGRLEVIEKIKTNKKIIEVDLTNEKEKLLEQYIEEIQLLIKSEKPPAILNEPKCKKCAYFEYCYI